jgi:Leucine-rich repeat (LRR) protein
MRLLLFLTLVALGPFKAYAQPSTPADQVFLNRCNSATRTRNKDADQVVRAFTEAAKDIVGTADNPDCQLYERALEKAGGLEISGVPLQNASILASFRNLTSLTLTNDGITSLSGIEKLDALLSLDLSDNSITDLTPLKSLRNLRVLKISNNKIADLSPLSSMQHLRSLDAHLNRLKDINVLNGLSELLWVELGQNSIKSVAGLDDFFARPGSVNFNENLIEDGRPIPGTSERRVDLSNNPADQIYDPPRPTLPILRPLMLSTGGAKLDRENLQRRNRIVACGPREKPYSDEDPFGFQDLTEPCGTRW